MGSGASGGAVPLFVTIFFVVAIIVYCRAEFIETSTTKHAILLRPLAGQDDTTKKIFPLPSGLMNINLYN